MADPGTDPIRAELELALAGRYSLERELGRGGMGAVFLARDLRLDRLVAVKVLPPELAVRPELRERFLRETRTAASFSHPNIVAVHSVEETPALLYFVMSFVEGETLAERVKRQGPLPVPDAIRLIQEVAWALSYAHGRGVVHRDIKPDNILVERGSGRALVMDFGISRSSAASGLTQVGESLGTPHFMSPEQAAGEVVDGRADLYSLGVSAFYAVTGTLPFDGGNAQAIMAMHLSQPAPAVASRRPDLPAALAAVVDRCLLKEPERRFATGEALVETLESVRGQQVEVPPPIRLWVMRADQFFRNGLILGLVSSQIVTRFGGDLDQLIFGTLFLVAVLALWTQVPLGMGDLARQGYSFSDLVAGVRALDQERAAALAAMRAAPNHARRQQRHAVLLATAGLLSAALLMFAFSQRTLVRPGTFQVTVPGVVAAFLGVSLGMGALVFAMAGLARRGKMDQRLHRLWSGRLGRFLFRIAGAGDVAGKGSAGSAVLSRAGMAGLLETLPAGARKNLDRFRPDLERLEGEVERLGRRERELDTAMAEARAGAATWSGGESEGQRGLIRDLETARQAVTERRAKLLAVLEGLRVQLLRVKSGIGPVEAVVQELAGVRALVEAGQE